LENTKERKKAIGFVAFVSVLFICLLFLEIIFRLFKPLYFSQPIDAYQYDKDLGYRVRPGIHIFSLTDYEQEFRSNKLGTLNFQEKFSDYEFIIFTLGDSFTQGLGVPPDASYPFQLDLILNIDNKGVYKKKYGVVNVALGPYGGEQEFLVLKLFAEKIKKPNIVLYLGCDNDYNDDILFKTGIRHKNMVRNSPYYGWLYYPMKWVLIDTEIGKRIKYIFQEGFLRAKAAKIESQESQGRCVAEMERNVIERINATSKEYGSMVILSWCAADDSYYWLKSWAAQNNIAFADWEPSVKSITSAIPLLPMNNHHSGDHYRAWVNYLIAREFARQINNYPKLAFDNKLRLSPQKKEMRN
jgi:hypothetical protein